MRVLRRTNTLALLQFCSGVDRHSTRVGNLKDLTLGSLNGRIKLRPKRRQPLNEGQRQKTKTNYQNSRNTPTQNDGLQSKTFVFDRSVYCGESKRARFLHCLTTRDALVCMVNQQQRACFRKFAVQVRRNERLKIVAAFNPFRLRHLKLVLAGCRNGDTRPNTVCRRCYCAGINLLISDLGSDFVEDGFFIIAFHDVSPDSAQSLFLVLCELDEGLHQPPVMKFLADRQSPGCRSLRNNEARTSRPPFFPNELQLAELKFVIRDQHARLRASETGL